MIRKLNRAVVSSCSMLALLISNADLSTAQGADEEIKSYRVDVALVSFDASQSLASYRGGGRLSGSPGATLGTSTPDSDISILLLVESDHFYADLTIQDRGKADASHAKTQRIDLTNLRATVVDLGIAKDGRSYHLNLTPSVRTITVRPKPFKKAADDLYRLQFHSSRVMLNDREYIGRMFASDSLVFSMDVCDVASVEFSLLHLKDAKPWGRLQDGQLTINHPDGTTIEIGNVTNGSDDRLVGNGPYLVWVRWEKPQHTSKEYRAELTAYCDRVKSGDIPATAHTLAALEKELAREPGPWVISSGARDPSNAEFVRDE